MSNSAFSFSSSPQPLPSGRQSPTKNLLNGSPSKCPRFAKVKNWETGSVLHDTLHLKSTMVRESWQVWAYIFQVCFARSLWRRTLPRQALLRRGGMFQRRLIWFVCYHDNIEELRWLWLDKIKSNRGGKSCPLVKWTAGFKLNMFPTRQLSSSSIPFPGLVMHRPLCCTAL